MSSTTASNWNTHGQGSLLDAFGKAERSGLGGREKSQAVQQQLMEQQQQPPPPQNQRHFLDNHNQQQNRGAAVPHHLPPGNQQHQPYQHQPQSHPHTGAFNSFTPRGGGGQSVPLSTGVSSGFGNYGAGAGGGPSPPMPPQPGTGLLLDQLERNKRGVSSENELSFGATPSLDAGQGFGGVGTGSNSNLGGTNMMELQAQTEFANVPGGGDSQFFSESETPPPQFQHHQQQQRQPPPPQSLPVATTPGAFDPNMFGDNASAVNTRNISPVSRSSRGSVAIGKGAAKKKQMHVGTGVPAKLNRNSNTGGAGLRVQAKTYSTSPARDRSAPPMARGGGAAFLTPSLDPTQLQQVAGSDSSSINAYGGGGNSPPASYQPREDNPYSPDRNDLSGPVVVGDEDRNAIEELFATDDFAEKFNAAAEARGQQVARESDHNNAGGLLGGGGGAGFLNQQSYQQQQEYQHQVPRPGQGRQHQQQPAYPRQNNNQLPAVYQQQQQQPQQVYPQQMPQPQYNNRRSSLGGLSGGVNWGSNPGRGGGGGGGGGEPVCHICSKQLPKDGDVAAYLSTPFDPTGPTPRRKKVEVPRKAGGAPGRGRR